MTRVAIAVDKWKAPVFKQRLATDGFAIEEEREILGLQTLLVETDRVGDLQATCIAAMTACETLGNPRGSA